jgi:ADP-ribose pyrophosphatase
LAKELTIGKAKLDHGEFLETHEVEIRDLIPMVHRGEITDVKTQIGVFWLEKILKERW